MSRCPNESAAAKQAKARTFLNVSSRLSTVVNPVMNAQCHGLSQRDEICWPRPVAQSIALELESAPGVFRLRNEGYSRIGARIVQRLAALTTTAVDRRAAVSLGATCVRHRAPVGHQVCSLVGPDDFGDPQCSGSNPAIAVMPCEVSRNLHEGQALGKCTALVNQRCGVQMLFVHFVGASSPVCVASRGGAGARPKPPTALQVRCSITLVCLIARDGLVVVVKHRGARKGLRVDLTNAVFWHHLHNNHGIPEPDSLYASENHDRWRAQSSPVACHCSWIYPSVCGKHRQRPASLATCAC